MAALEFSAPLGAAPWVERSRAVESHAAGCFASVYTARPHVCLAEDRDII